MMTFVDATQSCARGGVPWDGKVSYASVPGIRNQGGTVRAVMKSMQGNLGEKTDWMEEELARVSLWEWSRMLTLTRMLSEVGGETPSCVSVALQV